MSHSHSHSHSHNSSPQQPMSPSRRADVAHHGYISESQHAAGAAAPEENDTRPVLYLNGNNLTVAQLMDASTMRHRIDLSQDGWGRVRQGAGVIRTIVESDTTVYGINTGFGAFADVRIDPHDLSTLQVNLIRSHAAGTGATLPLERTRLLFALRLNVFAKGHSGISEDAVRTMIRILNKNLMPWVPVKGTVGASGDLAQLAHMALGIMGEGKMWDPVLNAYDDAGQVLVRHGITPVAYGAKEGLAMINGTQFITALGAEAVSRAENLLLVADIASAMSLEALRGTVKALDPAIHNARKHPGQIKVAERLRAILGGGVPSEIQNSHKNCSRVQDSYTLRCVPQVHGIANDTLVFVKGIIEEEMNSATDNPMVFAETGKFVSGGNFHGEYPAKALDYLAIGIHELANMSERRIERLNNPVLSELPPFLVRAGGLNSGFMIAHCTAAALVSENKVLAHPSSVDSISTSAAKEDHVSMGGFSARKALEVVENCEKVLAIELLCAAQGIDLMREMSPEEPLATTPMLEKVHRHIRSKVAYWDKDRYMAPDIEAMWQMIRMGEIVGLIQDDLGRALNNKNQF